jgi:hypothetical protein
MRVLLCLSWRAVASLKKNFRFPDVRRWVSEHFGLKNQHLAADGFLPAFLHFSSKASEMHMLSICCFIIATFRTLSDPSSSLLGCGYKPGKYMKIWMQVHFYTDDI